MKKNQNLFIFLLFFITLTGCSTLSKSMREPNTNVELYKNDFIFSNQVKGEATTVKVFCIDWARLFTAREGRVERNTLSISLAAIPVIGTLLVDRTANYALYDMMIKNPGYDVVFYPQYEIKVVRPFLGIGIIYSTTKVKTIARLGKINDQTIGVDLQNSDNYPKNSKIITPQSDINKNDIIPVDLSTKKVEVKKAEVIKSEVKETNIYQQDNKNILNNPFHIGDIVSFTIPLFQDGVNTNCQIPKGVISNIKGDILIIKYPYNGGSNVVKKNFKEVELSK